MPSIISYTIIRNASNRYLKAEVFPQAQRQGTIIAITVPTLIARVALISLFSTILSYAPGLIGSVIGPAITILVAIIIGSTLQYNFLSNRKIPIDYRLPIINTLAFAFLTIFSIIPSLASDTPLNLLQQILSIIAFFIIDQLCAKLSTSWH
jgi:predicted membrane-bound spermidine synthase